MKKQASTWVPGIAQKSYTKKVEFEAFIVELQLLWSEVSLFSSQFQFNPILFSDIPASGVYLSVYEYLKTLFANKENNDSSASPVAALFAGGFAGLVSF